MLSPGSMLLAFLEGVALTLSPCILPVLPLVLGASVGGSRARPLGIVAGFVLAFTAFAILSRQAVLASGLDAEIIRNISLALLGLFGLVLLFPALSDRWSNAFQGAGNAGDRLIGRVKGDGFGGGIVIGALIGVVWTPCAGPILAAAVLQIVQASDNVHAFSTIAAFALGAGIPMGLLAFFGRDVMNRLGFLKKHSYAIRRVIGAVMIIAAIGIYAGLDLKLVSWQASFERGEETLSGFSHGLDNPYPAPELAGITGWINTEPLTLAQLRGKVVLIDVWTYSCINCIRTLPHVTRWYDTYKDDGLVVIGVHAPEFPFERKLENVQKAVRAYGIHYPVALDNDYATWRAYNNKYWPAHYLIDREGKVVYQHFGEGKYNVTEANIRSLLGLEGGISADHEQTYTPGQTPETYLGYARAKNFAGSIARDAQNTYAYPADLALNQWALQGPWTVHEQMAVAGENASLRLRYTAGKVHLVMGSDHGSPVDVDVLIDGKQVNTLTVADQKLYTLDETPRENALLELKTKGAGLAAYAFTFGK